ncbi:SCO family protein [Candidatus Thioglobus sp.]|nr:SCO family protein [Candidatus Thioglobus sp.]
MSAKFFMVIGAAILLIAAVLYSLNGSKDYRSLNAKLASAQIMYNPQRLLSTFSLSDHNGDVFNNNSLMGDWSLVLFIYTHCPDVCPTELANMAMLKAQLENKRSAIIPKVVAITFDPLRDTPKVLKTYVSHFDKAFIGISGDTQQIDQLVKDLGAYYERVVYDEAGKPRTLKKHEPLPKDAIDKGYVINHTARVYLMSPDGQVLAGFPTPHKASDMANDIELLIKAFEE